MEASNDAVAVAAAAGDEEAMKEAAALDFSTKFGAMMDALQTCVGLGVNIVEELDKLGVELPPFAAALFGAPEQT